MTLSRGWVHRKHEDSAVGKRLPASRKIGHVVDHQYASGNRPRGFQLAVRHDPLVERSDPQPPHELTSVGSQTVHPPTCTTEQTQTTVNRGRRINTTVGRELPAGLARGRVQRNHLMRMGSCDKQLSLRDHRR